MREVFVEKRQNLLRIALKENDELVECFAHEDSTSPQIGEIYKARVKNIIPGINSIFLDIGLDKEAISKSTGLDLCEIEKLMN